MFAKMVKYLNIILEVFMKEKDILTVIEELGKMIAEYKDQIKFKDYEILALKNKIEELEK